MKLRLRLSLVTAVVIAAAPMLASAQRQPMLAVAMPEPGAVNLYELNGPQVKLKKSVPVGKAPGRMCLSPDGSRLYVATGAGASAIDLTTFAVATSFTDAVIKRPFSCLVSDDGRKLYVADRGANTVLVFSADSGRLIKKIPDLDERPPGHLYTWQQVAGLLLWRR